jgi:hypothetical protein
MRLAIWQCRKLASSVRKHLPLQGDNGVKSTKAWRWCGDAYIDFRIHCSTVQDLFLLMASLLNLSWCFFCQNPSAAEESPLGLSF